jgi:hypothetical protein
MSDKSESGFDVDLPIRVFGVDDDDHAFSQMVHLREISDRGARLSGLDEHLKRGDIIGVHFGDKTARCNVVWVMGTGGKQKIDVGVEVVEGQPHPWQREVETQRAVGTAPISGIPPIAKDKRRFPRQRTSLEIEIRTGQSEDPPMRTKTADISGNGCYIETMLPLPVGTVLMITFWPNSDKVRTTAIVRTCDHGVGMGIEFIGLNEATQKRLQRQVETIATPRSH